MGMLSAEMSSSLYGQRRERERETERVKEREREIESERDVQHSHTDREEPLPLQKRRRLKRGGESSIHDKSGESRREDVKKRFTTKRST